MKHAELHSYTTKVKGIEVARVHDCQHVEVKTQTQVKKVGTKEALHNVHYCPKCGIWKWGSVFDGLKRER